MKALGLAILHGFVRMPLTGHLLSIIEGLAGLVALELYASGRSGWGLTAMTFALLFSYIDGASGWSTRKTED